ncbi:hypothetical protein AB0L25_36500 [Spirillospora sp. NPDC052242]
MSAAPLVLTAGYSLFGGESAGVAIAFIGSYECWGWMHRSDLWSVPGYTLLRHSPWAIVLPAFVVWLVTRRRAVGWTAVALLAPVLLAEPALFGYDVTRWGQTCVERWYPFGAGQVFWQVYGLVPLALVLAATYRPGTNVARTAAALLVTAPLLTATGDRDRPVPLSSPEACKRAEQPFRSPDEVRVQAVADMPERERKLAYLCAMRDYNTRFPGSKPLSTSTDGRSDTFLLNEGRRACEEQVPSHYTWQPALQQYVYLCPDVAAVRLQKQKRAQVKAAEEYEREQAKVEAFCERKTPDAEIRPVREYTDVLMGGLMRAYHLGEFPDGTSYDGSMPDELVVSEGGMATVTTGTEDGVCLTVRAYRAEPPPDLDGWERVVEVGFDSPDGRTVITQPDGPPGLPPVTVAGPGRYRLRLHVSGRGEPDSWPLPAQRHLLVVYPGESRKTEVLK